MAAAWETDFSKATVDLNELLVGLPYADPRDLIPPIDDPQFEIASESTWLADQEPGIVIEIEGDARFYPLSVLTRHEIVNDAVGGVPVAVTYCPLCNTAVSFDRRFGGDVLRKQPMLIGTVAEKGQASAVAHRNCQASMDE